WQSYAEKAIQARQRGVSYSSADINLEGKEQMDAIRADGETLVANAQAMQKERMLRAQRATRTALLTLGLLTAAVAVVLVIVTRYRMMALSETYNLRLRSERQQTEEARSNREWLLTTLRSIGEGVIATDPNGRIEFLNAAGENLTGW